VDDAVVDVLHEFQRQVAAVVDAAVVAQEILHDNAA